MNRAHALLLVGLVLLNQQRSDSTIWKMSLIRTLCFPFRKSHSQCPWPETGAGYSWYIWGKKVPLQQVQAEGKHDLLYRNLELSQWNRDVSLFVSPQGISCEWADVLRFTWEAPSWTWHYGTSSECISYMLQVGLVLSSLVLDVTGILLQLIKLELHGQRSAKKSPCLYQVMLQNPTGWNK